MIQKPLFLKMFFYICFSVDSGQIAKEFARNWAQGQGLKHFAMRNSTSFIIPPMITRLLKETDVHCPGLFSPSFADAENSLQGPQRDEKAEVEGRRVLRDAVPPTM